MKIDEIIGKVKQMLTSQPEAEQMAEATLEDGTTVTAEAFEVGQILYVKTEEGSFVVAPAGTHTLSDGITVTVDDEGVITEISDPVEGEQEEAKKDDEKEEYVTQSQLDEFGTKILEGVAEIVKVMNSKQKAEVSDEQKAKIEAAKQEFASRRKKIEHTKEEKKEEQPEEKKFRHKYVNPVRQRIAENFKDFNFKNN